MSWRDRGDADDPSRHLGRPGGDWQGIRPTLDNPMTWSVPVGRVFAIAVRIHVIFVIYIVVRLAQSMMGASVGVTSVGLSLAAVELGALFGVVLLHEFGHCFACRWVKGEAHEILMWPLGGLAYCLPPHRWAAHFVTAAGGPLVNVVIFVVLAPVLGAVTGVWWGVAVPNPLGYHVFGTLEHESWWLLALLAVHRMSVLILLFNLLPVFPLDGGRLVQAVLWSRFGYVRAMRLAVHAGYFGAIALGIVGAVMSNWLLMAIAVFGGVTCYFTVRQLEFTESVGGAGSDLYAASRWSADDAAPADEPAVPSGRRGAREESEAVEVDRILAKIAEHGIEGLTRAERRFLTRATDRRRRTES